MTLPGRINLDAIRMECHTAPDSSAFARRGRASSGKDGCSFELERACGRREGEVQTLVSPVHGSIPNAALLVRPRPPPDAGRSLTLPLTYPSDPPPSCTQYLELDNDEESPQQSNPSTGSLPCQETGLIQYGRG